MKVEWASLDFLQSPLYTPRRRASSPLSSYLTTTYALHSTVECPRVCGVQLYNSTGLYTLSSVESYGGAVSGAKLWKPNSLVRGRAVAAAFPLEVS